MRKTLFLFFSILALLLSSCKKESLPVAQFDYILSNHYVYPGGDQKVDYVTVKTNNYSYEATSYLWILTAPDGSKISSSVKSPFFVCDVTGNYELKLTAYNDDGENSCVQTFYIFIDYNGDSDTPSNPPTASFNINSSNGIYAPSTIECNNTSVNATRYQWTLTRPDNTSTTSTYRNPSFRCTQSGTYTVQLIAYNAKGQSSTSSTTFSLTTPSTFKITYLRLEDIPMIDGNHASWDTGLFSGADPDIFFKILNSSSTTLYTSGYFNNVGEEDLPITWQTVNKTLTYNGKYYIRFYDYDDDLDGNEQMAGCILNTTDMTPGSSSFTWSNTNSGVRFVIGLTWQ